MSDHPDLPARALIAEDEPILATILAQSLRRLWPQLELVATCGNGIDGLKQALTTLPDVLFLDIKMPGKSGLQMAEELAEQWPEESPFPQIVFVTAYDEFALAAFDHAAADYVLKPVSDARLERTVARLRERLQARAHDDRAPAPAAPPYPDNLAQLMSQLRALMPPADKLTMIRAAVGNQVRMIPIDEVLYFEALDKYLNVVTAAGAALIRTSLKELLPQLDERHFWQVHRGTIVNARCIAGAVRDEAGKLSLTLRDRPEQLRVSPLYAHLFRQM
ncbi:LytTR family DNA-binding domain-containing protein [Rugamonas sp.]|uniref:LytR/AlgR family response regulator transcription factor n=1 Tax=Rugamonas sp. TaxID=1926287 RepID=UPI0025EB508F|nr:LytTR family DNA-binding domain-containing protein [Rugamonas sp.]